MTYKTPKALWTANSTPIVLSGEHLRYCLYNGGVFLADTMATAMWGIHSKLGSIDMHSRYGWIAYQHSLDKFCFTQNYQGDMYKLGPMFWTPEGLLELTEFLFNINEDYENQVQNG